MSDNSSTLSLESPKFNLRNAIDMVYVSRDTSLSLSKKSPATSRRLNDTEVELNPQDRKKYLEKKFGRSRSSSFNVNMDEISSN